MMIATLLAGTGLVQAAKPYPTDLKPPVDEGIWLRPEGGECEPVIGFRDGIRIAVWPVNDPPRGLVRVHTPYVFPDGRRHPLINFIAIEPIVGGQRGYSELEHSKLDGMQGKRMWFSDELSNSPTPTLPWVSPRGRLGKIRVGSETVETLSIVVNIEPLDNGAHPAVLVTFRADRPNEIGLKTFACEDSAPMESCVLTATMGNYSRTRLLWLKDEVLDSRKIWPEYKGSDFVWTEDIPASRVRVEPGGALTAAVTPSESDLAAAEMPRGGWRFGGKVSTQYWRKYPGTSRRDLRVRVNGRATYYGGHAPIPGGVAFENFEMIEQFVPGAEVWFGVTLKTPEEMGWRESR